jgi:hypothetical protein
MSKINTTTSKIQAIRAFINLWLSDNTLYCNSCGDRFNAELWQHGACCDNPQIGRNLDHTYYAIKSIKQQRENNLNRHGSDKSKTMRMCVSLPARLMTDLENYFKTYGEKLFNNESELHSFMKAFPQFSRATEV